MRLRDIAGRYGLFFVDQFGVLRDAKGPYPGAIEALSRLRDEGRRVVILSNSGKRSAPNEERLVRLGFARSSFDHFLTSGEVVWRMLADGGATRPKACLVLSRDGDASPIEGLGIARAERPEAADLVLIAGSEAPRMTLDDYTAILRPLADRGVPAICANPDMTMLVETGLAFGAGRIARLYESLGGTVTFVGKPYPAIYRMAVELAGGAGIKALGIGDSVEHDIAGAKGIGADACLVLAGIHAGAADLETEYAAHGVRPDHILESFVW